MCGIAGIVGEIDSDTRALVESMINALSRRGPDDQGIECWDGAILGHRRLAIFDQSDMGRQPMVSPDNSIGLVFNGAIYNYGVIKEELFQRGYLFKSKTDTEVLIHGYREWGIDQLVGKLRGMFAFALWDHLHRKLYLVRDRMGVKPLVYFIQGKSLVFASTVRPLRVAGFLSDLDEGAVNEFLELGFISEEHSIYRGAVKVLPGMIVEWSRGCLKKRAYWTPPTQKQVSALSFKEAVEEVERIFLKSVEIRLQADVPIAALLSGGIDSSLVCWAVKKLNVDIMAYTIGMPGDAWDETLDATKTAQELGIKHQVLEMSGDDEPDIENLISAYAEPFGSPSALGMLKVSGIIPSNVKVLLTGDGGDDVFLGYSRYRHLWVAGHLSSLIPSFLSDGWLKYRSVLPRVGLLRRMASLLDYASGDLTAVTGKLGYFGEDVLGELLGRRFTENLSVNDCEGLYFKDNRSDILGKFLEYERMNRFVGEYMTKVDGATMHYGLEARSPFLDHILWEFVSSLPFNLRLHMGNLKAILRALAKQKLGENIAKRPKTGFGVPVRRWIIGRWRPVVEALFHDSVLQDEGWINSEAVLKHLEMSTPSNQTLEYLWNIFVFENWMRFEKVKNYR